MQRRPVSNASDLLGGGAIAAVIGFAALCGIALSFAVPVLDAADEIYHWQRAVQVSQGQLLADRHDLPNGYGGRIDTAALEFAVWAGRNFEKSQAFTLSEARQAAEALSRSEGRSPASFPSTASFTPLAYLPQAAGIAMARSSGGNVFAQLMAGRIANLVVYLGLIAAAARLVPCGQRVLLALALTAPTLHLAASVSGDPLNLALPVLLVAWCLRLRFDASATLSRRGRHGLALLIVSLALLKPLYLLLAAIALLVPARHFGSRRAMAAFVAGALLVALMVSLAWNAAYPFVPGRYWGTGADPRGALLAIADDPAKALGYFIRSLQWQMPIMWMDGWGRIGGFPPPFMMNVPKALSWAGLGALIALALADACRPADRRAALLMGALAALFTCAVFGAFWIAFTAPGSAVIQGVQGRYFQIAFVLLALAVVCAAPSSATLKRLRPLFLTLALTLQAAALIYGIKHFHFYWAN